VIPAIALSLAAIAGGTLVSYAYDDEASPPARLAYGTASGLVALALIAFVFANFLPIVPASVLGAIVVGVPLAALVNTDVRGRVIEDATTIKRSLVEAFREGSVESLAPVAYAFAMAAFVWLVFDRVIIERDGALFTGFVNNLGDLPFHIDITSSFAYGENFPPEDPMYAGTGFAYPYLADFLAAVFVAVGASLREAFLIQNVLLGLALVMLLYRFTRLVTGDRLAGFIAPVLVLLSGGLGWVFFLQDTQTSEGGLLATLGALTRDYTISPEGPLRWGNAITTLLVTQRSLLLGLPIALICFVLLWKLVHVDAPGPPRGRLRWNGRALLGEGMDGQRIALAAGVLTGVLPLVHAHSFAVVIGTAFFVGLFFRQWREGRWRAWASYVIVALALALPQIWWSTHDSIAVAGTFFGLEFGWDHREEAVPWFWFLNTGLFIPLAIAAYVWRAEPRLATGSLLLFTAAFLVWFILPNLVKLAPWVWDNIKVLFYWFVGFVPLVALVLARLLKSGPGPRAIGAACLLALTLAGALDNWRVLSGQTTFGEFDRDGITLASQARQVTPPDALLLNAPTWNTPVFLTGRRSLLGYTGHVWSRGLPYAEREAAIARIYAGEADASELLERYAIDYVVVSPIERGMLTVNDAFFASFPVVAEAGEYRLYEVPRP
jgi:hypothetical protein